MNATDTGPLDNDAATDFLVEWQEGEDYDKVEELLSEVLDLGDEYIEVDLGAAVVAAGHVIVAVLNENQEEAFDDDEDSEDWAFGLPEPSVPLLTKLVKALKRIKKGESEIKELWEETDDFQAWTASINEIIAELS